MAKKDTGRPRQESARSERPEWPKPLVRLKQDATAPGGYGCEVRLVGDADGESAASAEGFLTPDLTSMPVDFQEYPKWVYHTDGRRQIVHTQAEAEALEGYTDTPPAEPTGTPLTEGVPPPTAGAALMASANRPPVPADRG